jgi:hypothetical protein
MEQLIPELVKQSPIGLVAGIFLWFYVQEKKEHNKTRQEKDIILENYRKDIVANSEKVINTMSSTAQAMALLTEKIQIVKRGR